MKRSSLLAWKLLAVTCVLFPLGLLTPEASAQKAAQESEKFFARSDVIHLEIELGPKELEALRVDPDKNVKATLKEGTKVYKDVAVHLKGGAGSFRPIDDKPSMTLNMDKFKKGQRFHGMDKFHLANSMQDPTYLSELISGELFCAAGTPAARVNLAVVTINGKKRGVYYLREGFDKYFLGRNFGNDNGNFYEGAARRDVDQPLELLSGKKDVEFYQDLKALAAAAKDPNLQQRFQIMAKVLDLDKFLSYLVMEVITWDRDGYPLNRNNFRIYHDPKRDKLFFIPSGMDQMFRDPYGPILPKFKGLVAQALLETPEGKERYLARLDDVMKKVFTSDALVKRLDELQARVQPVLAGIDAAAGQEYPNHVNRLKESMRLRQKNIEDQLKRLKK